MFLSRMTIRTRVLFLSGFFLLGLAIIQVFNVYQGASIRENVIYPTFEKQLLATTKEDIKAIVSIEADILSRELKGLKSREEIFAKVEQQTDPIRFLGDGSGYFFTYATSGDRISVPINKSLNGKSCLNLKDSKGLLFVEEFAKAAKNGGGYVTYYFEKEGKGVQPKLSYVMLVPGTDVIIGTGVYIDNIDDDLVTLKAGITSGTQRSNMYLYTLLAVMLVLLTTTAWVISRSILKPIGILRSAAQHIGEGEFEHRIGYSSRDELGVSAGLLNQAFDKVIDKVFWYESLLDSISYPISVTDMDMNWTFVNKAAMAVTGAKREEILGKQCSNWGADICGTERCGIACLRKGVPRSTFSQPGLDRDFQVDTAYLLDRSGKTIGHIEVVQDVTEANTLKAKAEQALKDGIHHAAQKLESIVEIVTTASEELAAQVEQASRGSEIQAERVGETATAMEEMNATVLEVAKNASQAAGTSENAKNQAESGAAIVGEVVQGIGRVHAQAVELKNNMSSLGKQAEGIGQILNTISDIADQTNLLALNAAIEAARAGEAGRGFAVVADEVRKLAEKTMTATKEVGQAIRAIQDGSRVSIDSVDKAAVAIEEATTLANKSGEALRRIVSLVDASADQVRSIATASEEQSSSSEEINRAIEEVNRISAETSQVMVQSAKAVAELAEQSQQLKNLIREMDAEGGGANAPEPGKPKALRPAGR